MSKQENVQRIGAYAWCLILAVAGGALIIGALNGIPGEEPGTVFAQQDTPPRVMTEEPDRLLQWVEGAGITQVSKTE